MRSIQPALSRLCGKGLAPDAPRDLTHIPVFTLAYSVFELAAWVLRIPPLAKFCNRLDKLSTRTRCTAAVLRCHHVFARVETPRGLW